MTQSHFSDVDNPDHYKRWRIEPITFLMRNNVEYWRGNVIKYVMRAGYKTEPGLTQTESEIKDLKKAIRYLNMQINLLNGETEL